MNWAAALVPLVPLEVVTVTSTVPLPAGEVPVIEESLLKLWTAALLPKLTEVTPVNPVPIIVTLAPPVVGPLVGEIEVTRGVVATAAVQKAVTVVPSFVN